MKLDGLKVVVLGGSSDTGLVTAKASQAETASVVIASRSQEKLDREKKEIANWVKTFTVDTTKDSYRETGTDSG